MQDNYIVYFAQAASWHTAGISLRELELQKALMKRLSEDEQAENESNPAGQVEYIMAVKCKEITPQTTQDTEK